MVQFAEYLSPLGTLLLTADGGALTGLWMNRAAPADGFPAADNSTLLAAAGWLDDYFRGEICSVTFPLAPAGSDFQQRVWKRLLDIPYGETVTYGDIAREMEAETGRRMSAQAVGGAVGRNPISILIPCHRVVGARGSLTGYAGGLDNKIWLLRHEGWKGSYGK